MSATTPVLRTIATVHDTHGARRLLTANNPAAGLVVDQVVPDLRRISEWYWYLLEALGKDPQVTGKSRDATADRDSIIAFISAYPVHNVVLLDAQFLGMEILDAAVELAEACKCTLWLVAQQPIPEKYPKALGRHSHIDGNLAELAAILKEATPEATRRAPRFPRVPAANYPTFRAEAKRSLTPEAFAAVDALYASTFAATRTWLSGQETIDEDRLVGFIRPMLDERGAADEMFVVIRAVQAAAHRGGWLVNADPIRLIITADTASRVAVSSPETWDRLAAYRDPYRGAACAAAAVGLGTGDMLGLRLGDLNDDATTITFRWQTLPVPTGADVYLRAQRHLRVLQGACDDDRLFADSAGKLMRPRLLALAIRAALLEVGVALAAQSSIPTHTDSSSWLSRWGLSVQELT